MPEPTNTITEANDESSTTDVAVSIDQKRIIKRCLQKLERKIPIVRRYKRYYDGAHDLNFASEKFTTAFAKQLHKFRDNLCKTCVKAPADRLEIIGFASDTSSDVYATSWAIWKRSQMPKVSKRIHRDAFKTGDGFAIAWAGSDGKARIVKQDPENCTVFYNPETDTVEFGAKLWRGLDDFLYLTVYTTTTIEKYRSKKTHKNGSIPSNPAAFEKRAVEGESWPITHEFGVCPLFHFGIESSILDDVIPLQDALNKSCADLLVSSEANSLRQRWTTGISYEVDPETGKQIIPFERASQWFAASDVNAKFGEFQDATLEQFIKQIEDWRLEIASVAGIPHYYFRVISGDFPSGEALTKAESRFTSTIEDAQLDFGETWSQVMKLCLAIDGEKTSADADAGDDAEIADDLQAQTDKDGKSSALETQWSPAAPMSDNEKADLAIKKKDVGISEEQALSEIGYTDAKIAEMQKQKEAKAKAAASSFKSVFDAGGEINDETGASAVS